MRTFAQEPIRVTGLEEGPVRRAMEEIARQTELRLESLRASLSQLDRVIKGEAPEDLSILATELTRLYDAQLNGSSVVITVKKHSDLYELRWKREGDTQWNVQLQSDNVFRVDVENPVDRIVAQVRYRPTPLSPWSDWTEEINIAPDTRTTGLSPVTGLFASSTGGLVSISWDPLDAPDLDRYEVYFGSGGRFGGRLVYAGKACQAVVGYESEDSTLCSVYTVDVQGNYSEASTTGVNPSGDRFGQLAREPDYVGGYNTIDDCSSTTGWTTNVGALSIDNNDYLKGGAALRNDVPYNLGSTLWIRKDFSSSQDWSVVDNVIFGMKITNNPSGGGVGYGVFFEFGESAVDERSFQIYPPVGKWARIHVDLSGVPTSGRNAVSAMRVIFKSSDPKNMQGIYLLDDFIRTFRLPRYVYRDFRGEIEYIGKAGTRGSYEQLTMYVDNVSVVTVSQLKDVTLRNPKNANTIVISPFAMTANITVSGLGGLDAGSEAPSTWYYVWVVADSDHNPGLLLSASSSSPTVPSGYVYRALLGAVYNDASSNLVYMKQMNRVARYTSNRTIVDGAVTTGAWTALSVGAFFPPIAKKIRLANGRGAGGFAVSPLSSGQAGDYSDVPAAVSMNFGVFPTARDRWSTHEIPYEGTGNIYYFSSGTPVTISALGWEL